MRKNIGYLFSYFLYSFVYIKHFYFSESIYAKNAHLILLVYYWISSVFFFLCIFMPVRINNEKDYKIWFDITKKNSWGEKILTIIIYSFVIGLGVIGEWMTFIPCVISSLSYIILIKKLKSIVEEYKKKNNVPELPESKSIKKSKPKSRYDLVKKK